MQEVALTASAVTMTSREIAALTEKQHQHVKRDIEKMLAELGEDASTFGRIYQDSMNREQVEYRLDRVLTDTLLTGYSAIARRRVVARWHELEGRAAAPALPSYPEALRQLASTLEENEQHKQALALAAPKVEFHDRYAASTGNKGFREVCKLLHANEREFREFLINARIMYRLAGELTPMAQHIDAGRFVVKAGTSQGTGHAFNQPKFTPKGVTWIAGEWAKHCLHSAEYA